MKKLNEMTLEEKVGQVCMFGFDGLDLNDDIIHLIKKYKLGNVILFARNVKTPEQLFKLNQNLQKLALKEIGIPMLISIDQEGGMVTRIFNGATFFPGAMTISATKHTKNAYEVGRKMGRELNLLGINMNLAPVLDVNNNPKNPVIGVRSYSDDPKIVAKYGIEYIKGLQEEGVIATAKHFPGHGDTNVDSHLGLPVIHHGLERLEKIEFYPFKEAIKAGIKGVMSSHINFPMLTHNDEPATLSKTIMTDLLRNEFKFDGLIISDGMGMKGVVDKYTTEEACVRALIAGINLVCVCHAHQPREATIEAIYQAIKDNRISIEMLDKHVEKILKYKVELKINLNLNYKDIQPLIENEETKNFSLNIVKDATTLVKGNPIHLKERVLYIGILPQVLNIADDDIEKKDFLEPIKSISNLDIEIVSLDPTKEEIEKMINLSKQYEQVIFTTYNGNQFKGQIHLIEALKDVKDLHVIALRNPYDLYETNVIKNYVAFYEYTPNSLLALKSYLLGEFEPKGQLPFQYKN